MPRYDVLGISVELPWSLDGRAVVSRPAELSVSLGDAVERDHARLVGAASPIVSTTGDTATLIFPNVCELELDAMRVVCRPCSGVDERTLQRFVLDHVLPRFASRRYDAVLHASAVELAQGVVAFVAESGRGKSTLALSFALEGHVLFADDALVLAERAGHVLALPLYNTVRVETEALPDGVLGDHWHRSGGKTALGPGAHPKLQFASAPRRLAALYLIAAPTEDIAIAPVRPRDAVVALLKQSFHLELDDLDGVGRLMGRIEALGLPSLCYELSYPRDRARLPEVHKAIIAHAGSLGISASV